VSFLNKTDLFLPSTGPRGICFWGIRHKIIRRVACLRANLFTPHGPLSNRLLRLLRGPVDIKINYGFLLSDWTGGAGTGRLCSSGAGSLPAQLRGLFRNSSVFGVRFFSGGGSLLLLAGGGFWFGGNWAVPGRS